VPRVGDEQLKVKIRYHATQISAMSDLKAKKHLDYSVLPEHKDLLILQLVEDIRTLNETLNIADKVLAGYKQKVDELMRDAPTHAMLNMYIEKAMKLIADLPSAIVGELVHAKTAKKLSSRKGVLAKQQEAELRRKKMVEWLAKQPKWRGRTTTALADEAQSSGQFKVTHQTLVKDINKLR
jgi:hypothetical protein